MIRAISPLSLAPSSRNQERKATLFDRKMTLSGGKVTLFARKVTDFPRKATHSTKFALHGVTRVNTPRLEA